MPTPPFFANTADDTHCVQAAFKMILKYFWPERDFSYAKLDQMSQKQPGKGSWWPPMLIELRDLGLEVKCIEGFNYEEFYRGREEYVKKFYRRETAEYYLKHSNLLEIRPRVPEFLQKIDVLARPATLRDLDQLLNNGWLVGIDLNAAMLNDMPRRDYVGHMVMVFGRQNKHYMLHDPGLPPRPNRSVNGQKLADAWFWSGRQSAGLIAVKNA